MGYLVMNEQERQRKVWIEMVEQGRITLNQASIQLGVSYRQAKRIRQRYRILKDEGLIHQGRGRRSNRRHPHREEIIGRYKERYEGFGPTLASEKLCEDGYLVNHETLRRWLLAEGLWVKQRKRSPYRRHRERRAQFGELVQLDGSIHDWFEEGRHYCLFNMVDDATGKTLARLEEEETTAGALRILWQWITRYGAPLALYVDLKNIYVSPKEKGLGHIERACAKLGIRIIKAYSPQAKGRVERNHGVYQDRFVKELRLRGIKTLEEANQLLEQGFIDQLNHRFEKPPRNPQSAHRSVNGIDLNQVLCWEYQRKIQHDWTFSFNRQLYQIKKEYGSIVRPKVDICIRKHLDGSISAWYQDKALSIVRLTEKPVLQQVVKKPIDMSERGRLGKAKSSWDKTNTLLFKSNNHFSPFSHLYLNRGHFYCAK